MECGARWALCALAKLRVRHLGKIDKETNSAFIPIVGIPWPAALLLHSRSIDAHRTREPGRKRIANVFRVQGKARGDYVGCVYVPNGRDRGMQLWNDLYCGITSGGKAAAPSKCTRKKYDSKKRKGKLCTNFYMPFSRRISHGFTLVFRLCRLCCFARCAAAVWTLFAVEIGCENDNAWQNLIIRTQSPTIKP